MRSATSQASAVVCAAGSGLVVASYALPWVSVRVLEMPGQRLDTVTWTGWKEVMASPLSLVVLGAPGYVALLGAGLALWRLLTLTSPSARGVANALLAAGLLAGAATTVVLLWLAKPDSGLSGAVTVQLGMGGMCLLAGGCLLMAGSLAVRLADVRRVEPQRLERQL